MDCIQVTGTNDKVYDIPIEDEFIIKRIKDTGGSPTTKECRFLNQLTLNYLLEEHPRKIYDSRHLFNEQQQYQLFYKNPCLRSLIKDLKPFEIKAIIAGHPEELCGLLRWHARATVSAIKNNPHIDYLKDPFTPLPKSSESFKENDHAAVCSQLLYKLNSLTLHQLLRLKDTTSLMMFIKLEPGAGNRFSYSHYQTREALNDLRDKLAIRDLIKEISTFEK